MEISHQGFDAFKLGEIAGADLFHGRNGGGVGYQWIERQSVFPRNPGQS